MNIYDFLFKNEKMLNCIELRIYLVFVYIKYIEMKKLNIII